MTQHTPEPAGRRERYAAAMYGTSQHSGEIPWERVPQSFREPWLRRADAAMAVADLELTAARLGAAAPAASTGPGMTTSQLRAALAQFDDATPLRFAVPEPGDDQVVDTSFVAVSAGFGEARYADERGTVQDTFVTVELETTGRDPLDELMNYAQPRPAAGR